MQRQAAAKDQAFRLGDGEMHAACPSMHVCNIWAPYAQLCWRADHDNAEMERSFSMTRSWTRHHLNTCNLQSAYLLHPACSCNVVYMLSAVISHQPIWYLVVMIFSAWTCQAPLQRTAACASTMHPACQLARQNSLGNIIVSCHTI